MMKLFGLIICSLLVCCSCIDIDIKDLESWNTFQNNVDDFDANHVTLSVDLNPTDYPLNGGTSIGFSKTCRKFVGVFDGQNHKISGYSVYGGFFCGLRNAVMKDLTFEDCKISGNVAGVLAGEATDDITLTNISSNSSVIGQIADKYFTLGGLIGLYKKTDRGGSIDMTNCTVTGPVVGTWEGKGSVGGLIGTAEMYSGTIIISLIDNPSLLNVTCNPSMCYVGGLIGNITGSATAYISSVKQDTIATCRASGAGTFCYCGGMFGAFVVGKSESFKLYVGRSTVNFITQSSTQTIYSGSYAGYIVLDSSSLGDSEVAFTNCYANATAGRERVDTFYVGGFIGHFSGNSKDCRAILFDNCTSVVKFNTASAYGRVGGFVGILSVSSKTISFYNCTSLGSLRCAKDSSSYSPQVSGGGFVGYARGSTSFQYCENYADIDSDKSVGFVFYGSTNNTLFSHCVNSGLVKGETAAYGFTNGGISLSKYVVNKGRVTASTAYPLWPKPEFSSIRCDSCFSVEGTCDSTSSSCTEYKYISTKFEDDLAYHYVQGEEKYRTDDKLNEEAILRAPEGICFSRNLDLDTFKIMHFNKPLFEDDWLIPGNPMDSIQPRVDWDVSDYIYKAKEENDDLYFSSYPFVDHDLNLSIALNVTTIDNESSELNVVDYEDVLNVVPELNKFFQNEFYAYEELEDTIVNPTTVVTRKMLVRTDVFIRFVHFSPMNEDLWMFYGEELESLSNKVSWNMSKYVFVESDSRIYLPSSVVVSNLSLSVSLNVTITDGQVSNTVFAYEGQSLGSLPALAPIFSDKTFAVIDVLNMVELPSSFVVEDHILVSVQRVTRVHIDTEPFSPVEFDVKQINQILSILFGPNNTLTILFINDNLDASGNVTAVIIGTATEEDARTVLNFIDAITPGENCTSGILCKKTNAYIEVVVASSSSLDKSSSAHDHSISIELACQHSVDIFILLLAILAFIM